MEQIRKPVEKTVFFDGLADGAFGSQGRPLWSPAPDMPAAWTAGRDKPVPYDRCSPRVQRPGPRGGDSHSTDACGDRQRSRIR